MLACVVRSNPFLARASSNADEIDILRGANPVGNTHHRVRNAGRHGDAL